MICQLSEGVAGGPGGGRRVGGEGRGGGVGAAGGGGLQGGGGAAEELEVEVGEGDRRVVFEGGRDLPVLGEGDLAGQLDEDPRLGVVQGDVDGYQGVEGIVEGVGEVDRAGHGVVDQRRVDRHRGDLRGVGAVRRPVGGLSRVGVDADLGGRATVEAVGSRRVHRQPLGQGDHRVPQVRGGRFADDFEDRRFFFSFRFYFDLFALFALGHPEVDLEAGGLVGDVRGRVRGEGRLELELVAAGVERQRRRGARDDAGLLPGGEAQLGALRLPAGGGKRQEGAVGLDARGAAFLAAQPPTLVVVLLGRGNAPELRGPPPWSAPAR